MSLVSNVTLLKLLFLLELALVTPIVTVVDMTFGSIFCALNYGKKWEGIGTCLKH